MPLLCQICTSGWKSGSLCMTSFVCIFSRLKTECVVSLITLILSALSTLEICGLPKTPALCPIISCSSGSSQAHFQVLWPVPCLGAHQQGCIQVGPSIRLCRPPHLPRVPAHAVTRFAFFSAAGPPTTTQWSKSSSNGPTCRHPWLRGSLLLICRNNFHWRQHRDMPPLKRGEC
jgi:hypothetical protein